LIYECVFSEVYDGVSNARDLIDGINRRKADILVMFPHHYVEFKDGLHGRIKWFHSISAG
jgi:hypothetical protein